MKQTCCTYTYDSICEFCIKHIKCKDRKEIEINGIRIIQCKKFKKGLTNEI